MPYLRVDHDGGVGDAEPAESSEWADLPLALRRPSQVHEDDDDADDDDDEPVDAAEVADDEVDDLLSSSTVYADLSMDSSDVQMDSVEAECFFLLLLAPDADGGAG